MAKAPVHLFLGRESYRQRRLRDALRLLPLAGGVGWLVPLLWTRGAEGPGNGTALLYVFGLWAVLIGLALVLSLGLRPDEGKDADRGEGA